LPTLETVQADDSSSDAGWALAAGAIFVVLLLVATRLRAAGAHPGSDRR
jgi:hypothetical protein